ncbi:unnamed protein product [Didymodactylos carnosus]|uniref:Uncharacterized protein n=1 Tax=Didymodactylos carnosus TaxID=1234261 RepID=A0A8S2IIF6_9BILA|nr:unnamed protein product [Didymodactylos carnosus]CAF3748861.1 unnamed protein product [Didymodactylos carnosus]
MLTNYIILFGLLLLILMVSCRPPECQVDNVDFLTKVRDSPIVLLGETMTKNMFPNAMNQFNVTFQVSCIFKGKPTNHTISISQAGFTSGRNYCQDLAAGTTYIVFLEERHDVYRPMDFQEIEYSNNNNSTLELLDKTCNLTHLKAKDYAIDECPPVSTACYESKMDTIISSKHGGDDAHFRDYLTSSHPAIISGDMHYEQLNVSSNIHPIDSVQDESDATLNQQRGKSQFSDEHQHPPNHVSSTYQSFIVLISFIVACVVFVQ